MNTWKLSSFDLFSLNMTIKGAWIYRNVPDFDRMKTALARIREMYPHLCGRYSEKEKSLVWDEGNTEPLPFSTLDLSGYSADELIGNRKVWGLVAAYDLKAFKEGRTGPFSAVLARLKDGAILYVQCAHATMDGSSFYGLVNQWASLYRGEPVEPMTIDQSLIPAPDAMSKEETIRKAQENGWGQIKAGQLVKMLWNLFRNNRIKNTFSMTVSQDEISLMKTISGAGTNAVLSAMAVQAFSGHLAAGKHYKLLFVADLRGRIGGIDSSFFGNISQPVVAGEDFDPAWETDVLACRIEKSLREVLESGSAEENVRLSQCSSHYGLPYFYFDASDMNSSDPGTIYINNQLKFRACDLDWGHGKPEYAFPNELTDMVKFWQPVSGGPVEIIFGGLAAKIMR